MKKFIIITLIILSAGSACYSQNYMRSFGLRISDGFFMSYRHNYSQDKAVEVFLGYHDKGISVIGMREFFVPALKQYTDNLLFVYGFGIHAGVRYTNEFKVFYREYKREEYRYTPLFGLDGYSGLEYQLPELPIIIALTLKPYIEYSTSQYYKIDAIDGSFTLRFCF